MFIVLIILKRPLLDPTVTDNFHPISVWGRLWRRRSTYICRGLWDRIWILFSQDSDLIIFRSEMALIALTNDFWWAQGDLDSTAILIHHDLSAAFSIINHSILLDQLRGLGSTVLQYFSSFLWGRFNSMLARGERSSPCHMGALDFTAFPFLFNIKPLGEITCQHGIWYYKYPDVSKLGDAAKAVSQCLGVLEFGYGFRPALERSSSCGVYSLPECKNFPYLIITLSCYTLHLYHNKASSWLFAVAGTLKTLEGSYSFFKIYIT